MQKVYILYLLVIFFFILAFQCEYDFCAVRHIE